MAMVTWKILLKVSYLENLRQIRFKDGWRNYMIVLKNTLKSNLCIYSNKVIMTHKTKYIEVL